MSFIQSPTSYPQTLFSLNGSVLINSANQLLGVFRIPAGTFLNTGRGLRITQGHYIQNGSIDDVQIGCYLGLNSSGVGNTNLNIIFDQVDAISSIINFRRLNATNLISDSGILYGLGTYPAGSYAQPNKSAVPNMDTQDTYFSFIANGYVSSIIDMVMLSAELL